MANRLKLLSWNVAGRTRLLPDQIAAVLRREADIVALQEVRASTAGRWAAALAGAGLGFALDSAAVAAGRRLFNLTASRWPLDELPPIGAPQPERVLSASPDPRPGRSRSTTPTSRRRRRTASPRSRPARRCSARSLATAPATGSSAAT